MLTLWNELASPYALRSRHDWGGVRRQMDALLSEAFERPAAPAGRAPYRPEVSVSETPEEFQLAVDVPGMSGSDLRVSIDQGTLTIGGARKLAPPEGYSAHRGERGDYQFTRSYALPSEVDGQNAEAKLSNGVLRVRLPKAAEVKPRLIPVTTS